MPKRFFKYSRTEPARTILFCVAFLTLIAETATLLPFITPVGFLAQQLANVVIAGGLCSWAVMASYKNNIKHMSQASFWLFLIWLWSGFTRLAFSPDPTHLLWVPMILVAVVMAIVHIYMEGVRKGGVNE